MDEQDLSADSIDLKLDEENELVFQMSIQGEAVAKPIYRLVCEANGMSLAFAGEPSGDEVKVIVPALQRQLVEGTHRAHLEVIADNRIFVPLQLSINFRVSTKVVVESVRVSSQQAKPKGIESVVAKVVASTKPKDQPTVAEGVVHKEQASSPAAKAQRTLADVYKNQRVKQSPAKRPQEPSSADLLRGLLGKKK